MPIRDLTLACRLCDPKLAGGGAAFEHSLSGYEHISGGAFTGGVSGAPASASLVRRGGGGGGGPAPLGSLVIALGMAGGEACRSMRVTGGGAAGGAGGQGVRTSAMATGRFSGMGPDTQAMLFLQHPTSTHLDVPDYDHLGALAGRPSGRASPALEAALQPSRTAALAAAATGGCGGTSSSQAASSMSARAALAAAESPASSANQAAAVAAVMSSGGGGGIRHGGGSPPLPGATHGTAIPMVSEHGGGFGVGLGGIGEGFREGEAAEQEEEQEPLLALYLGFREVLQESVLERVLEEMTQVVEVSAQGARGEGQGAGLAHHSAVYPQCPDGGKLARQPPPPPPPPDGTLDSGTLRARTPGSGRGTGRLEWAFLPKQIAEGVKASVVCRLGGWGCVALRCALSLLHH